MAISFDRTGSRDRQKKLRWTTVMHRTVNTNPKLTIGGYSVCMYNGATQSISHAFRQSHLRSRLPST